MSKKPTYKVWIEIEKYNPRTDKYEDIDPGFGSEGQFDSLAEAQAFASRLHDISANLTVAH